MTVNWKIVGASVTGIGHERLNQDCEDHVTRLVANGVFCMSLCDGVGSAKRAKEGARFFSQKICQLLVEDFEHFYTSPTVQVKQEVISTLRQDLLSHLPPSENLSDFASTLLCVALKDEKLLILHLGDGVIGCLNEGELAVLSEPVNFDYANVTVAVTSEGAEQYLKVFQGKINQLDSVFLMSDGAETSLYSQREKRFSAILIDIVNLIKEDEKEAYEQLEELIRIRFRERTSDDCSLILLVKDDQTVFANLELADYPFVEAAKRYYLLNSLPKSEVKGLSVRKVDRVIEPIVHYRSIKRTELKVFCRGVPARSVRHTLRLFMRRDVIGYDASSNEFYIRFNRDED